MRIIYVSIFLTLQYLLQSQTLPDGFVMQKIIGNINPVATNFDNHGRIWIAEKHGRVSIIENGKILTHPFIELHVDDFNERGLMGIALHPNFEVNNYVYLYYTVPDKKINKVIRVKANGDTAIPGSEESIIEMDSLTGSIHNGGAMLFDNQNHLYIATGEGGKSADAQRLDNLNGKILRLNDDGTIPVDNPFYNTNNGKYKAIYSYGLRNPFSMTIDHHSQKIFVSDVGQGLAEEVNEIISGKNYGWPIAEGIYTGVEIPNYVDPIYTYGHDVGCAIVGAAVFDNHSGIFPQKYNDAFFFADYCKGFIKYLNLDTKEVQDFGVSTERPLAIHFTKDGKMYLVTRSGIGGGSTADNTITFNGAIFEIKFTGSGSPFISEQSDTVSVPEYENAIFSVQAYGNNPLTYAWEINGVIDSTNSSAVLTLKDVALLDHNAKIICYVSNILGVDTSATMTLQVVSNRRPKPQILMPFDDYKYTSGDTIHYKGRAIDEGKLMSAESLSWKIDQHHNEHAHPMVESICCISNGFFIIPTVSETSTNVWIRITLFAKDSLGLTGQTYLDIYPNLITTNIKGPQNAKINIDGTLYSLPINLQSTKGIFRIMTIPHYQIANDSLYLFSNWEDGNDKPFRTFFMNEELDLSVFFKAYPLGLGNGLKGEYFNDPEFDLDGLPVFTRVDTLIKFNWGNATPGIGMDADYFTVRWSGYVQSILDEEYTFFTFSDDGARLYINDSLIINEWHNQSIREHAGKIKLTAGRKNKIVVEYMEAKNGAQMELKWSSLSTPKQHIPKRQLYLATPPASIIGEVFLDDNDNGFFDSNETPLENVPVILIKKNNKIERIVYSQKYGQIKITDIDSGNYKLHLYSSLLNQNYVGGSGLDEGGFTPEFRLFPSQLKIVNAPFRLMTSSEDLNSNTTSVYPNPFSNTFEIFSNEQVNSFYIYNEIGDLLTSNHDGKTMVNFDFPKGIYFIKIVTANNTYDKKIICIK